MIAADVLHILWSGRIGGIERQVAAILRYSAARGGQRHAACLLNGAGVVGDALVREGLAVSLGMRTGLDPRELARLGRLLGRLSPRVVHMHTHALGAQAVAWTCAPRAVRVYTEHSPRALTRDRKFRVLYGMLRAQDARLVALSPAMATAMVAQGARRESIAVVPNAVDIPRASLVTPPALRGGTIGVVARLAPQKRVDLLLDVLVEMRRRGVSCRGLVVGDGPLAQDLRARREALGLEDVVEFAGERDDVTSWLDRMDVFLMTSGSEPFGIAALEAMARGVPVVAMPCPGGLGEIVARGGLLLPDRQAATAADALAGLLISADHRQKIRTRGWAVVDRHAPADVVHALEELYRTGDLRRPAAPRGR